MTTLDFDAWVEARRAQGIEPSGDDPFSADWAPPPASPGPSTFEWDNGLQSAKRWSLELASCKAITPTVKVVGWVLREYVHVKDGTVYLSSGRIASDTGRNEDNVKKDRSVLQAAGWFEFTGEFRTHPGSRNPMKVWRLTVPACGCGAHTPRGGSPVSTRG